MIKILFVINYIEKNGPSMVVKNIINNLSPDEYEVSLVTLFSGSDKKILNELKSRNVMIHQCTTLNKASSLLGNVDEFEQILRNGHFDIIHSHGFIPDIIMSKIRIDSKKITTLHNNMFEDYPNNYGVILGRLYSLMHLRALKKIDSCICCSKSVYNAMNPYLVQCSFIRNGIEPIESSQHVTLDELNISRDARIYVFAGALIKKKNILYLVREFSKYRKQNEYLLLLGEGQEKEKCIDYADDHVRFLGFINNPATIFEICNTYISASKTEGLSISIIEAMACGLNLLLSDIPSHNEFLELESEEIIGYTFKKTSFEKGLSSIRDLKTDKKIISDIQKRVLSAEHMTTLYDKKYREVISND